MRVTPSCYPFSFRVQGIRSNFLRVTAKSVARVGAGVRMFCRFSNFALPSADHRVAHGIALIVALGVLRGIDSPVEAATAVRITNQPLASTSPAIASGPGGRLSLAWSDSRDGNSEIYYCALDPWGNRLTPDVRVSNTSGASIAPKIGLDAQGFVYICWKEGGNIGIAKLDWQGNAVVAPKSVDVGSYVVFMNPDISALAGGGCAVGFAARTGALDDVWVVNYDAGLNKICNTNSLYHNLTGTGGPPVSLVCGGSYSCALTWYREGLFDGQALSTIGTASNCSHGVPADACGGTSFPAINSHGRGIVYERSNHIYLTSGSGCGIQLSENPGPSITPSAAEWAVGWSIAVWDDRRGGNADVYYGKYSNTTFTKSGVDTALITGSSASITPAVASDGQGSAFIVWQDNRDGNSEIYFARTPEPPGYGTIAGTVYNGVTGQPMPFAQIDIVYPDRPEPLKYGHIVAGADGRYRLAGLTPAGPWALSARSAGFVSPQVTGIEAPSGQTVTVDLYVSTGTVLSGTIRDVSNGLPIGRAVVRVDSIVGVVTKGVETGPDGRYRFDLYPGTYKLFVGVPALGQPGPFLSLTNPFYNSDTAIGIVVGAVPASLSFQLRSNTVVLVHGIRSDETSWGTLLDAPPDTMRKALEAAGWHTEALSYDWKRTIEEAGGQLHRWVLPKVFRSSRVVAHSMGGLTTRWCAEQLAAPAGEHPFTEIITLGTLHHGTPAASNGVNFVKAFIDWLAAKTAIPGIDQLTDLAIEAAIRKWIPFVIDFEPGSERLNQLNYGPGHSGTDGERFCGPFLPDPAHAPEMLLPDVRYVAFAGDNPQDYAVWDRLFMNGCPSDGAVPVHSAKLYNTGSNVSSFLMSDCGSDQQCQVRHVPQNAMEEHAGAMAAVIDFKNSTCVQDRVREALSGAPIMCGNSPSRVATATSTDTLMEAIPAFEHMLSPGGSATDVVAVPAGARLAVLADWRQDGLVLDLVDPVGTHIDSAACVGVPGRLYESDPASGWARIEVEGAVGGNWTLQAVSVADSAQTVTLLPFLSGDVTLDAVVSPAIATPGSPLRVTALLQRAAAPLIGASVTGVIGSPEGASTAFVLVDNGTAGDLVSGDGVYSARVTPDSAGTYALRLRAFGGVGLDYGGRETRAGFQAMARVDIAIPTASLSASSPWAYPSDPISYEFLVKNDGAVRSDSVWVVARDESLGVAFMDTVVAIAAHGSSSLVARFRATQLGVHWLSFSATALGGAVDANSTNSRVTRGAEIVAFGSLPSVSSVPWSPPTLPSREIATRVLPNPSHGSTVIEFELLESAADVRILIVDAAGRRVALLTVGRLPPGVHRVPWRTPTGRVDWRTGVFFYRIQADALSATGRIVMTR